MFFKTIREITIKNHRQYFQIGVCHIIKNCHLFQDDSIINSEDKSIYRLWNISMSMVIFSSRSVKTFCSK
jgi:hypothetical protein